MAQLQYKISGVKGFVVLTDREHMPRNSKLRNVLCFEDILQVRACMLFLCSRQFAISKLRNTHCATRSLCRCMSSHRQDMLLSKWCCTEGLSLWPQATLHLPSLL